uniref:hypothetical protein n=1 Tax=Thaumasiovibrio occultus TaxID=1891184 RepID=UPI00131DFB23|nr:hypothetical protein [Thaumasiovibrio occultus]
MTIQQDMQRERLAPNDPSTQTHRYSQCQIVGKTLEIGKGAICDELHDVEFIDCEIQIYASGQQTFAALHNSIFRDCLIWARQPQVIPTWQASFYHCTFKGTFEARFPGPVIACDFSQATLTSVAFQQQDGLGAVVWPPYPHVVMADVPANYADWQQIEKPPEFNRFIVHPRTKGQVVVFNLASVVADPAAFWQRLKDKPYISSSDDKA